MEANSDAEWLAKWMGSVTSGQASMSQRKLSSVETHGGLQAAIEAARSNGVHLLKLTDDKGDVLIAASREPFETLC